MNDLWKILVGLLLFLIIVSYPVWYNIANGKAAYKPDIEIATKNIHGKDQCVMPTEYMRTSHMELLNEWRNDVVRKGEREHIAPNGKRYNRSLTNTCLDCHANKDKFCDQCHNYMGVDPYCWECHVVPKEVKR